MYIATYALTLFPSCSSEISYEDAIKNNDFEAAHKCLDKLYSDFEEIYNINEPIITTANPRKKSFWGSTDEWDEQRKLASNKAMEIETAIGNYYNAVSQTIIAEIRYILASGQDEEFQKRFVFLINGIKVSGKTLNDLDFISLDYGGDKAKKYLDFICYKEYVNCVNSICKRTLDLAIAINDHTLAKATYDMALISQIKEPWGFDFSDKEKSAILQQMQSAFPNAYSTED